MFYLGVDCGSTTVKVVLTDNNFSIVYKKYERHNSRVLDMLLKQLAQLEKITQGSPVKIAITGSAGMGMAESVGCKFVQEVFATKRACDKYLPGVDAVVELGGEDAKLLFLTEGTEERMNGSCAGGTGSFIDQMATLMSVPLEELDVLYNKHEQIYDIASRCGVFAKSDIQSLLNQGASKPDITASIFQAIVNQTIAGLAAGRPLVGKIAFLGGPLSFFAGLRTCFVNSLNLTEAIFPVEAEFFVAKGAALLSKETEDTTTGELIDKLKNISVVTHTDILPPLFNDESDYRRFKQRHSANVVKRATTMQGDVFLGIDAGSTTTKLVVISDKGELLYDFYAPSGGDPVELVRKELLHIYDMLGDSCVIRASTVTGYGEDLLKNAFKLDAGVVETVAHYLAAQYFEPKVDFILDIGGQDIKCFKLKEGVIDSLMLNEACSSGCGSFISAFASALGYSVEEFAKLGLFAKKCVNLGSRCTVFMNSSVKQAQKDGASVEDISAGLSVSVVKNALYKVIRARNEEGLGKHIVVQGGTFMNDAILRAFELEIGRDVVRPDVAGLMGALGAALYASKLEKDASSIISKEELKNFTHTTRPGECKGCANKCKLTVNMFSGDKKYISGNRCSLPLGGKGAQIPNLYRFKRERVFSLPNGDGENIGIPMGLSMYENLPFWQTLFAELGFCVRVSGASSRALYVKGQYTIPSDTVCYPAKLMHGHVEVLLDKDIRTIFLPCMPYGFEEGLGDNNYNCPVVAHYSELLNANVPRLRNVRFIMPYIAPHKPRVFTRQMVKILSEEFDISRGEIKRAVREAYDAYYDYKEDVFKAGDEAIDFARKHSRPIVILAGRPYHIDQEVNHGIDVMLGELGCVVISEDAIRPMPHERLNVLNQWTYHARLYEAANFCCRNEDANLVQLVSFGCGLDAVTSDQVKDILESKGKLYTQIKIDEISNLGAAKIRLRSLLAVQQLKCRGKV